jgi:hypothetical protein
MTEPMDTEEGDLIVLDPVDTTRAEIDVTASPPATEPDTGETIFGRQVRYFTAIMSFGAGVLHLLAMAAHIGHHPTLGRAFLAVAVLQIVWGVLLIVEPRRVFIIAGAVVTVAAIVVWVFSRTKGISWFPGMEHVEALEWRDVVTQFFQLLAVAGAAVLLLPASVYKPAAGKKVELLPIAIMSILAIATLGILYVATYDYTHGEGGEGTEHGH